MHKLACPKCGQEQETVVWNSVNVSLDPELRQKLFDAQINRFTCESCKNTAFIDEPLLYHDMNKQYCVQYYPLQELEDESFLKQFTADGRHNRPELPAMMPQLATYLTAPHVVLDMSEIFPHSSGPHGRPYRLVGPSGRWCECPDFAEEP